MYMIVRALIIILACYCAYLASQWFNTHFPSNHPRKKNKKRESTKYDQDEWEKIKKELQK